MSRVPNAAKSDADIKKLNQEATKHNQAIDAKLARLDAARTKLFQFQQDWGNVKLDDLKHADPSKWSGAWYDSYQQLLAETKGKDESVSGLVDTIISDITQLERTASASKMPIL